jgi:hypothetical protein
MKTLLTGLEYLGLVFGGTLLGGGIGLGAAFGLARLLPGYYPGVFPHLAATGIDPTEVGMGLGFSQGMILGAVVSLGVAAIVAWLSHRSRLERTVEALADQVEELNARVGPAAVMSRRPPPGGGSSEHIRPGPGTPQS